MNSSPRKYEVSNKNAPIDLCSTTDEEDESPQSRDRGASSEHSISSIATTHTDATSPPESESLLGPKTSGSILSPKNATYTEKHKENKTPRQSSVEGSVKNIQPQSVSRLRIENTTPRPRSISDNSTHSGSSTARAEICRACNKGPPGIGLHCASCRRLTHEFCVNSKYRPEPNSNKDQWTCFSCRKKRSSSTSMSSEPQKATSENLQPTKRRKKDVLSNNESRGSSISLGSNKSSVIGAGETAQRKKRKGLDSEHIPIGVHEALLELRRQVEILKLDKSTLEQDNLDLRQNERNLQSKVDQLKKKKSETMLQASDGLNKKSGQLLDGSIPIENFTYPHPLLAWQEQFPPRSEKVHYRSLPIGDKISASTVSSEGLPSAFASEVGERMTFIDFVGASRLTKPTWKNNKLIFMEDDITT